MAGTQDKLTGKTKEGLGKVTGDHDLEAEGKGQHAAGMVKDAAGKVKDAVEEVADKAKDVAGDAKHKVAGR